MKSCFILSSLFLMCCQDNARPKILVKANEWEFDRVNDKTLLFANGKKIETDIYELQYIGKIQVDDKAPYLIMSGRDCNNCDADIAIYFHSPANGALIVSRGQNRYQYPGTEKDYETGKIIYTSRAFYGEVLNGAKGIIWYGNSLQENGKVTKSAYFAEISKSDISGISYPDHRKLEETEILLKKGLCKEITGAAYYSEP